MQQSFQAHQFSQDIITDLHRLKIPALILGGNACSFYRLPHMQKDLDVMISPAMARDTVKHLSGMSFHGSEPRMLLTAGAPLDKKWLNGGWTSHIYFGHTPQKSIVRLDFFGGALRTCQPVAGKNPRYLSRSDLAQTKKSQRGHDWDYVNFLGLQMLMRGDLRGILHINDLNILQRITVQIPIPAEFLVERPLLRMAQCNPSELERHLLGERFFWQKLDSLRQEKYLDAWIPYGEEIKKHSQLSLLSLFEQNLALIILATCALNPEPISPAQWIELIEQARLFSASMIRGLDTSMLPYPSQMQGQLQNPIDISQAGSNKNHKTKPLVLNNEYQESLEWSLGTGLASLCNLPYAKMLNEIHDFQENFNSPRDQAWPTEYHNGPELP